MITRPIIFFLIFFMFCIANGSQLELLTNETYFKQVLSTIIHGFPVDVQRLKEKRVAQEYNVPHLTAAQVKEYASLEGNSARKKELAETRLKERTFYVEDSQSHEGYSAKVFNAMETFKGRVLVSVLHAATVNRKKERDKARDDRDKELKELHDAPQVENDEPWSYVKASDRKHKMQLCTVILTHADQILSDPAIRKDLPAMVQGIRSQTPEEPTAAQLPLMPRKYFNVMAHVLDSWRPHLEKYAVCAEHFKHIEYDLRKAKPLGYETRYFYTDKSGRFRLLSQPPEPIPHNVVLQRVALQAPEAKPVAPLTIPAGECVSPHARRQAMSPHSTSYNALPETDSKKGMELTTTQASNATQSAAAAKPNPLSPVSQALAAQITGAAVALQQKHKTSVGAAAAKKPVPPKAVDPNDSDEECVIA